MIDYNSLPEPFLGRLIIKTIKEDAETYLKEKLKGDSKVSDDFINKLELPTLQETYDSQTGRKTFVKADRRVPISKGIIIKKAPDAFGTAFHDKFGDVGYTPSIGDIIYFIPNESSRIDPDDKYHFINDGDIQGYIKVDKTIGGCVLMKEEMKDE